MSTAQTVQAPANEATAPQPKVTVSIVEPTTRRRHVVEARRGERVYADAFAIAVAKQRRSFLKEIEKGFDISEDEGTALEQELLTQLTHFKESEAAGAGDASLMSLPEPPEEAPIDPKDQAAAKAFLRNPDMIGELRREPSAYPVSSADHQ